MGEFISRAGLLASGAVAMACPALRLGPNAEVRVVTNESYASGMAVKEAVHGVPLETLGGDVQLRSETNSEGSLERLLVNVPPSWGWRCWS